MPGKSHEAWGSIRTYPVETSALVLPGPQFLLCAKVLFSKILLCDHNADIKELVQSKARKENYSNFTMIRHTLSTKILSQTRNCAL